ncbi:MAG: hypothetical protein NT126_02495 [Bacteroidetes bacterium]|nr:hypothetical protein [Bacteroidota bacterium]
MKKLFFCFVISLAGIIFLQGCEKDKGPVVLKPPPAPGDTLIHFENDIQPVFDAHCIVCHSQNHIYLDLREGYAWYDLMYHNPHGLHAPYVDTISPENSILIQHLRGVELGIMPPNALPLPATTIDTIAKWMLQGARNN